ncbi:DNA polymerase I, putative [Entamoeba invadens IP1]|uniref:DNA-directed DNA polymerase n=1 Tax=Entamoeba invadens IP1 TaxID=370355 RepID=A0A0A1UF01_ENTIV|nr:DNA polymerase I, putative [Entamoeba invadens IP1]ELP91371.1 DNA polymerase I, putative [Entamoeba invadens IP1]|eukprot:XP_004258142.1 DNA polymerase I, putative [Entamoeba invadens IP1]
MKTSTSSFQYHPKSEQLSEIPECEIVDFLSKFDNCSTSQNVTVNTLKTALVLHVTRNGIYSFYTRKDDTIELVKIKKDDFPHIFQSQKAVIIHNLQNSLKVTRNGVDEVLEYFSHNRFVFDTFIGAAVLDPGSIDELTFNQICVKHECVIVDDNTQSVLLRIRDLAMKEFCEMESHQMTKVFFEQETMISGILIQLNMQTKFRLDLELLFNQRRLLLMRKEELGVESRKVLNKTINLASAAQVKRELNKLGFQTDGTKLKGTTSKNVLEQIDHPFAKIVLEHRKVGKILSDIDSLKGCGVKIGDEMYITATWNQTKVVTGRIQSIHPNLQQINKLSFVMPKVELKARDLFISEKGKTLAALDYNQIELRILADFTGDEHLVEFFKSGVDVHRMIASHWLKKKPETVTDEERRRAKTIVYGCIYGIGPYSLADELKVTVDESKNFLKSFLEQFPSFEAWKKETIKKAREVGFVYTLNNRRRRIFNLNSKDVKLVAEAERMAVNSPIQGSAADIIKMCMIKVFHKTFEEWKGVTLLLNIHDEIVVEIPDEMLKEVCVGLKNIMEHVVEMKVPLIVSVETGKKWGSLTTFEFDK